MDQLCVCIRCVLWYYVQVHFDGGYTVVYVEYIKEWSDQVVRLIPFERIQNIIANVPPPPLSALYYNNIIIHYSCCSYTVILLFTGYVYILYLNRVENTPLDEKTLRRQCNSGRFHIIQYDWRWTSGNVLCFDNDIEIVKMKKCPFLMCFFFL